MGVTQNTKQGLPVDVALQCQVHQHHLHMVAEEVGHRFDQQDHGEVECFGGDAGAQAHLAVGGFHGVKMVGFLGESEVAHRPGYVVEDVGDQGVFGHDVKLGSDLDGKCSTLGRGGRSAQIWYFSLSLNSMFHSLTLSTSCP